MKDTTIRSGRTTNVPLKVEVSTDLYDFARKKVSSTEGKKMMRLKTYDSGRSYEKSWIMGSFRDLVQGTCMCGFTLKTV